MLSRTHVYSQARDHLGRVMPSACERQLENGLPLCSKRMHENKKLQVYGPGNVAID